MHILGILLLAILVPLSRQDPTANYLYYTNIKDEIYDQPVNLMASKKNPHEKEHIADAVKTRPGIDSWAPYDFSRFEKYLSEHTDDLAEQNRVKREAKRRRNRGGRRRGRLHSSTVADEVENLNGTTQEPDVARRGKDDYSLRRKRKKNKKEKLKSMYENYDPPNKDKESNYIEMPKDLYQAHLRPGVIFRIHMSEAILKMQYRNYGEDKDESVIEADVEYLRLTRKVINDEITKFEDLKWLIGWFNNRSDLIQEHACNTRYFSVGIPPTMFTHSEEYMKRMCLFDNVYIDHIPYVVGDDSSLMAAVAPPVLHCDAATCTSVPFIDSVMFDERLARTNVRTVTRCQASCRAHCRNDPDCLKRCTDRCFRSD